jgi:hypothetical protein
MPRGGYLNHIWEIFRIDLDQRDRQFLRHLIAQTARYDNAPLKF